MFKLRAVAIAVVVLGACAEEPSVVEAEEEKGQIGASSGPNPISAARPQATRSESVSRVNRTITPKLKGKVRLRQRTPRRPDPSFDFLSRRRAQDLGHVVGGILGCWVEEASLRQTSSCRNHLPG
jgi:hypothetical protein